MASMSGIPLQVDVPHYTPANVTREALDFADLAIIDLQKYGTDDGRTELAAKVFEAMSTVGFFYVINHGYSQAQADRMFDIGDVSFTQVDAEEKKRYAGRMKETGSHQGYKLRNYWHIDAGVHDQVEAYNLNRDVSMKEHPTALRPYLPEIEAFGKHYHFKVLYPILRLLAIGLELPEDTFIDIHGYKSVSETFIRFMKYYPRSKEEEDKTNNVWLKGHTDFGSVTLLFSQPVSALQILSPDGKWRWVKHIDNALVINTGDAMEFLSGGIYKPTIHRVVQPPSDQRVYTRLSLFYFALPDDNVKLIPLSHSPVLQRRGFSRRCEDNVAPTMEQWRKGRTAAYGTSELVQKDNGIEEETINGLRVKHYR
ncbi:Clavaminate synthase-like protein [Collybia nuda]|uniref:Clavaminate synthase-like protein n=1 Tax=Collybia nuda TaxID=64659 RepID=A0A9P5XY86_9AGAR|nr:Clavaminate synthase-like protein [Collybia nuda]